METRRTIADLLHAKQEHRPIVAVSCYDYTTARLVAQAPADMILVGDTAAQLVLGHDCTLPVAMDFMVAITAAVRRGAPNLYLVADMPFLSYQTGIPDAIRNAGRFLVESGAQMVKIEATHAYVDTVRAVSDAAIPVMAHIGILPQWVSTVGQFRAKATTAEAAADLAEAAQPRLETGTPRRGDRRAVRLVEGALEDEPEVEPAAVIAEQLGDREVERILLEQARSRDDRQRGIRGEEAVEIARGFSCGGRGHAGGSGSATGASVAGAGT